MSRQPSLLPGDPAAEFASAEVGELRDDSDVDVDGLLELDAKGNVVSGNFGEVCMRTGLFLLSNGCVEAWFSLYSILMNDTGVYFLALFSAVVR